MESCPEVVRENRQAGVLGKEEWENRKPLEPGIRGKAGTHPVGASGKSLGNWQEGQGKRIKITREMKFSSSVLSGGSNVPQDGQTE